jgi:hypothetical protein
MYITIVFILTGLRRRCIINALGYVENSVTVCIIFHNMVGWASVCAVTWRSPCALRLFLHSFSIQAVCVHRNSRTCDCLLVADRHFNHIWVSILFRIIGLFIPEVLQRKKKKQNLCLLTEGTRRYTLFCPILPPGGPDSSLSDRIYPCLPISPIILFMNLSGLC